MGEKEKMKQHNETTIAKDDEGNGSSSIANSSSKVTTSVLQRPRMSKMIVFHSKDDKTNTTMLGNSTSKYQGGSVVVINSPSSSDVGRRWIRLLFVFCICAYFQWHVMNDGNRTLEQIKDGATNNSNHEIISTTAARSLNDMDNNNDVKAILKLSNDEKNINLKTMSYKKPIRPMWFGMGQGTTGTHSLYDATCRLNITSVHGNSVCINITDHPDVTNDHVDGLRAHFYALSSYKKFRQCSNVNTATFVPLENCTLDETIQYVNQMKRMIREVILSKSIDGIHDTPYTFMTPYVIQLSNNLRNNLPILITSERNPIKWSSRRAETHAKSIVCRHYFTFDEDYSSYDIYDAFDINHCLDLAMKNNKERTANNAEPLMYNDIFVSYRRLISEANGNETKLNQIVEFNRIAISNYQTLLRNYLIHPPLRYHIDLFERDGKVSDIEIANEIYNKLTGDDNTNTNKDNDTYTNSKEGSNEMKQLLDMFDISVLDEKIQNRSHSKMPHKFIKAIVQNIQSMPGHRAPYFVKSSI